MNFIINETEKCVENKKSIWIFARAKKYGPFLELFLTIVVLYFYQISCFLLLF